MRLCAESAQILPVIPRSSGDPRDFRTDASDLQTVSCLPRAPCVMNCWFPDEVVRSIGTRFWRSSEVVRRFLDLKTETDAPHLSPCFVPSACLPCVMNCWFPNEVVRLIGARFWRSSEVVRRFLDLKTETDAPHLSPCFAAVAAALCGGPPPGQQRRFGEFAGEFAGDIAVTNRTGDPIDDS